MLFNSISFAMFLPLVFILYWFITDKNLRLQNILLLVSSYSFYACWDYRFLSLLIFSTLLGYFTGIKIHDAGKTNTRRAWLWFSISVNLGLLGVFKYCNFFVGSFAEALSYLGIQASFWTLNVILPVGISFYTFHGLSYILDVYKERIQPTRNYIEYSVFVGFFPLLVAGPIERATHLLPQIQQKRQFNYSKAVDGLRQILWGLFKKVVIADSAAEYANMVFNNSANYSGSTLVLGAIFFAFQIYCDFSGYSDIAIGTAKLLGIQLLRNFAFPYFSRDIAEFWRRWHISLSSWFRDYLYIPVNPRNAWTSVRNIFIIFLASGLWHGANWTFIAWGALNAVYFSPMVLLKQKRNLGVVAQGKYWPSGREILNMATTFCLTTFAWIFFRANDLGHALSYISGIFSSSIIKAPEIPQTAMVTMALIGIFMIVEWLGREQQYAIANLGVRWPRFLRLAMYYGIILTIFYFSGSEQQFIYFQF
jgi:alginate O-acetyltransferase complex protein AlgI